MRATGVAFRTPVTVEDRVGNRGDGDTYAAPRNLLGSVRRPRRVTQDAQGRTVTRPMQLDLPHDAAVDVGARVTVGGDVTVVEQAEVVPGAFGVPHHVALTCR